MTPGVAGTGLLPASCPRHDRQAGEPPTCGRPSFAFGPSAPVKIPPHDNGLTDPVSSLAGTHSPRACLADKNGQWGP